MSKTIRKANRLSQRKMRDDDVDSANGLFSNNLASLIHSGAKGHPMAVVQMYGVVYGENRVRERRIGEYRIRQFDNF